MLSIRAVRGLPRLRAPGVVTWIFLSPEDFFVVRCKTLLSQSINQSISTVATAVTAVAIDSTWTSLYARPATVQTL